ncbi:hypothetical protein GUJ93_ZPchr0015g6857 [Zizania palustris]|uniref:Uncharacterized protein n=1 Tax=Zizania palustris TaxID=103762 RepID=A0A8J5T8Y5_ZIZPA|nr:hypothetical protein GUJ93_ZPchr0015g6857 [Zizania palustris]
MVTVESGAAVDGRGRRPSASGSGQLWGRAVGAGGGVRRLGLAALGEMWRGRWRHGPERLVAAWAGGGWQQRGREAARRRRVCDAGGRRGRRRRAAGARDRAAGGGRRWAQEEAAGNAGEERAYRELGLPVLARSWGIKPLTSVGQH